MKIKLLVLFVFVQMLSAGVFATSYTINFGGSFGFAYAPNSLNVIVGDTIVWTGSFTAHPLASTNVPAGAVSFSNSSGSTYSYVVHMAGTYDYQCVVHGFTGQFVAANNSGIAENTAKPLFKVSPTITHDYVNLYLMTAVPNKLVVDVMDMTGRVVMPGLMVSEKVTEINLGGLSNGIYFLSARRDSGLRIVQRVVKE